MTVMSTNEDLDAAAVAREAGLDELQSFNFRNAVASMTMEGQQPTVEEMRAGAELAAGRIDFAEYCRRLGV
jgi:hypothetical protein